MSIKQAANLLQRVRHETFSGNCSNGCPDAALWQLCAQYMPCAAAATDPLDIHSSLRTRAVIR
jgi:hypothetical protein